jgi:NAD(P)-dependent dehydrogenase (short-subunit alcohol dehydrogenase family)
MPEFKDFAGRVAVVTGGASGIGLGIAKAFIAEGARVVIADIEEGALRDAAASIGAIGIKVDVSKAEEVASLAEQVRDRFGRVDIVCNNAGVAPKVRIQDATLQDWRRMIDVNLWGVIHGINAFLPMLLENPEGGHIINTSSAGGFVTGPMIGTYSVTKAGVVALSEALDAELRMQGAKVGVTILAPGTVRTNLHTSVRNRPSKLSGVKAQDIDFKTSSHLGGKQRWITADSVGPVVVDAMRRGALYVTTHDNIADLFEARAQRILTQLRAPIPFTEELE